MEYTKEYSGHETGLGPGTYKVPAITPPRQMSAAELVKWRNDLDNGVQRQTADK